jgi:aryl carrier-like protein
MESLFFGRFRLEYDPDDDLPVQLFDDCDEMLDWWGDLQEARMDIDYSPIGEEITLEEWQSLWDFVERYSANHAVETTGAK